MTEKPSSGSRTEASAEPYTQEELESEQVGIGELLTRLRDAKLGGTATVIERLYATARARGAAPEQETQDREGKRCRRCHREHSGVAPDDTPTEICEDCAKLALFEQLRGRLLYYWGTTEPDLLTELWNEKAESLAARPAAPTISDEDVERFWEMMPADAATREEIHEALKDFDTNRGRQQWRVEN